MKKDSKLTIQIVVLTALMFIAIATISSIAVYAGSRDAYLMAKTNSIQKDLIRAADYIRDIPGSPWFIDYWEKHPVDVAEPMTSREMVSSSEKPRYFETEKEAVNFFEGCSDVYKLAFAKEAYTSFAQWLERELDMYDYDGVYIIDINDTKGGYVFFEESGNGTKSKLGKAWDRDINEHTAIRKLLSSNNDETVFEIVRPGDFVSQNYYFGYKPIMYKGEIRAVVCITYNWESFHKDLVRSVSFIIATSLLVMLAVCAVLLLLIRKFVITPIGIVRDAVRKYIKDKNGNSAVGKIGSVKVKNDIGELSYDVSELIRNIDGYIKDISKARDDIQTLSEEVMEALARTIDAKDKYTNGHSERVAIYSRMLGIKLGLSINEQNNLYYMGLLHDIGKIGIRHDLISKATVLTKEEYSIMKNHTVYGYEILSKIDSLPELAKVARWHHECYDGSGYPDGLAGEEIPFVVRIIAVADSYDAMTSNRSYRKYLSQQEVRAEIENNSGTQFDPVVAKAMLEIIDGDKKYAFHE